MRLFVALEIPVAVRENLAAVGQNFPQRKSQMRWVRAENFHVTLKFIGEVPSEKVEIISAALREVRADLPVEVCFRGLAWYWNAKGLGMLFGTIDPSASLSTLARDIDGRLEPLGIPPENRAFTPHLTLARCKQGTLPRGLPNDIRAATEASKEYDFGSMHAEEFHLIESQLGPGGSKYSTVASFRFFQAANA
jgi:RNA 2',3'-cyclic 3'-phosphodiesterase